MQWPTSTPRTAVIALPPVLLLALLVFSVTQEGYAQPLFVHTTYYFLMVTLLAWAGTYLHAAAELRRETIVGWVKENWPGLVVAAAVTLVATLAVSPALRILSDEANLVGTSKNLFANRTATFTVSGKNYFDSYWDIDVVIDRRPPLFPFLVSLVHVVCGYGYQNVFLFNLLLVPAFVLVCYRLAQSLGGKTFAVVAALLAAAHPITLLSARSGGFDFLATFFALLVLKSLHDDCREPTPARLAIVWVNLCMFAEIRYESFLFLPPVVALLFLFKRITRDALRPYALVYALTPAYLLPRLWQSILRGNVPEQAPGTITFSADNFFDNAAQYFHFIVAPLQSQPAHAGVVIGLGVVGSVILAYRFYRRLQSTSWKAPPLRFPVLLTAWMLLQAVVVFSYVWGRAQHPAAARLVLGIDTFFSLAAAWVLTSVFARQRPFVPILLAVANFAVFVPIASRHRMLNNLTQTREAAESWRFFEGLHERRILIVADRPELFTIMEYGAMTFDAARRDSHLFDALAHHLFYDLYVVQHIRLSTKEPFPGYEAWPDRDLQPVLEFQNDADVLVRISRVAH